MSAETILNKFKLLNNPSKILAFSQHINKLKTLKVSSTRPKTRTTLITQSPLTTTNTKPDIFSSAEVEMLKHQSYVLTPELNKKNKTYENLKRPCVDFNPCKHGSCDLNNETMQFSCICNVGYMGTFCDIMRHPCDFEPCEHGVCERVGDMYYKCLCEPDYTGVNCHIGM